MDLNLLVTLDALLQEKSVTKAAALMSLTPPAMSRALSRLRETMGDPILVRAGRTLVPTPRALAMRERTRAVLEEAKKLLGPEVAAAPAAFRRTFTLRMSDDGTAAIGPPLLSRVIAEAPGVNVRFVAEGNEDVAQLRDGEVDIDVGMQGALGPEIVVQALYRDRFVVVVKRRGRHARRRMTKKAFLTAEHVIVSRRGKMRGPLDDALAKRGEARRVRAVVPTQLAAAALAVQSDVVAMVSHGFAKTAASILDIEVREIPMKLEPIVVAQAWHPRFEADPAHAWLRKTLRDITRNLSTR